ncbi:class I SAM-dependent methyltransferase [Mucilaginibacter sp.]
MAANYNNSAWFYDGLARIVYGKALVNAQVYLLNHIPDNSKLLIVGGGTGWILEELTRIHPSGLAITYVEIAPNMMAFSKKRNTGNNQVIFINEAIENIELPVDFDVVLTPFLLDNFTQQNLEIIFNSINTLLKPNGSWLNASFQLTGKWWQQLMLKTMFIFFKVTCGIEASQLPGIDEVFETNGYKLIEQENFFCDFIGGRVHKK